MGEMITTRSARVQEILEHSRAVRETAARNKNWEALRTQGRGWAPIEPVVRGAGTARPLWDVLPDGSWFNQPCFIIGGGPSLKGFDFERLRGAGRIIALNKAFKDAPFADIMFAMDYPFLEGVTQGKFGEEYRLAFMRFLGMKVWVDLSGYGYPEDIFVVPSAGEQGWSKSLKDGLCHGQNSGYGALNLAIVLGANPIFLLGYDMARGEDGSMNYHDGYPVAAGPNVLEAYRKNFETGAAFLKGGPRIINLNPSSALKCFDFGDVDKVLPSGRKADLVITVITPTGDRPLAFALCQRWMSQQTRKPDQWIVVDDGYVSETPTDAMQYVWRQPGADDPPVTLDLNMRTALPLIAGDKILIMEDDEYYAPGYIEEMSRRLDGCEVVGIVDSKYYHLPTGAWMTCRNHRHASLAQTAFRRSFLPTFSSVVMAGSKPRWIDDRLWQHVQESQGKPGAVRFSLFKDDKLLYCGIKGLPGRRGIGQGHKPETYPNRDGSDRAKLKEWIPEDYRAYLDIIEGKP